MQYERPARHFRASGRHILGASQIRRACAGLTLLEVVLKAPKSHLLELFKKTAI
jgi:hypothetical protein